MRRFTIAVALLVITAVRVDCFAAAKHAPVLSAAKPLAQTFSATYALWPNGAAWRFNSGPLAARNLTEVDGKRALVWRTAAAGEPWLRVKLAKHDWSRYDHLNLTITSTKATGARINIQLTSPNDQGKGYYLAIFQVDWKGTRTVALNLARDFQVVRHPAGFGHISTMMISSKGWNAHPTRGTVLTITAVKLVRTAAKLEAVRQDHGRIVWEASNFNRPRYSGAVFYLNHDGRYAQTVELRYRTLPGMADGEPANFQLRVFGPDDVQRLEADLSEKTPGWYRRTLTLAGVPAGRYRIVFIGYFARLGLAADPAVPIGVTGAYALGLPGNVTDQYVYIPRDVTHWQLWISSPDANQRVEVFDGNGKLRGQGVAKRSRTGWSRIDLAAVHGPGVWRIHHEGDADLRLFTYGLPGVLYDTTEAARATGGDVRFVGNRRVDLRWQIPLAQWLTRRSPGDFVVQPRFTDKPNFAALSDRQALKVVTCFGLYGGLSELHNILAHQRTDVNSPWLGTFRSTLKQKTPPGAPNPDWSYPYPDIRYVYSLAWVYAYKADGINPYYHNRQLLNRVMAGLFQCLIGVNAHEVPFTEKATSSLPDTNLFGYTSMMGQTYALIHRDMPRRLAAAYRHGLQELFARLAFYNSYMNNQWMAVLVGLQAAARATGDPLLEAAYQRNLAAMLADKTGSSNFGQDPAGFYHEYGGIDGGYNSLNEYMIGLLYHATGDPRLKKSLEKDARLRTDLVMTVPGHGITAPRNINHRTDSSMTSGYPSPRLLADLPGMEAIMANRTRPASGFYALPWYCVSAKDARITMDGWWNKTVRNKVFDGREALSGELGDELSAKTPGFAKPALLGCQQAGPFVRVFGRTFVVGKFGPWYAILYNGSAFPRRAPAGSGLSALWHRGFGPLILGDTRIHHGPANQLERKGDGLILTLADAWGQRAERVCTDPLTGKLAGKTNTQTLATRIALPGTHRIFTRRFAFQGDELTSTATLSAGSFADHDVYFPLVAGPAVSLRGIDAAGRPHKLDAGQTLRLIGFRWSRAGHDLTLRFAATRSVLILRDEPCGQLTLKIVRVDFTDNPGAWSIR